LIVGTKTNTGEIHSNEAIESEKTTPILRNLISIVSDVFSKFLTFLQDTYFQFFSVQKGEKLIGISNHGQNCWAIATLHILNQLPDFKLKASQKISELDHGNQDKDKLQALKDLKELLEQYENQDRIYSQDIRLALRVFAPSISSWRISPEDPFSALVPLLIFLGMEYNITSTYEAIGEENRTKKGPILKDQIYIDCSIKENSSISDQLKASLQPEINYRFKNGENSTRAKQVKKLTSAPTNLLVKANRCEWIAKDPIKITTSINVDEELTLGEGELQNGPEAVFKLDSCVLHHGQRINGGHYTTLVRTEDGEWEWANDHQVHRWNGDGWVNVRSNKKILDQRTPQQLMHKSCYLLNYKNITPQKL